MIIFLFKLDLMAKMYPCPPCAAHMQEYVKDRPPTVGTRSDLMQVRSMWVSLIYVPM